MNARPNIVLIHGAWAEGSCWSGVIERLQADGYHVTAPQFPLTALADDVARLRQVLDLQDGPAILAGHSYGGQVMTALGAFLNPFVVAPLGTKVGLHGAFFGAAVLWEIAAALAFVLVGSRLSGVRLQRDSGAA